MIRIQRNRSANRALPILALALAAIVGAPRPASASKAEDILGEWTLAVHMGKEPRIAHLKAAANENGDFEGHIKSAVGEADIESFSLEGDAHILTYKMALGGQESPMKLSLKIEGENAAGSLAIGEEGGAQPPRRMEVTAAKAGSDAEKALLEEIEKKKMEGAGEPILPIADAGEFVGEWVLTVESPTQGTQEAEFVIRDVNGKASARLALPPPIGEQIINKIVKTEKGLDFKYEFNFGGNALNVTLALALADAKLSGTMADDNGMFEIPVAGVKKGAAPAPAPAAAPAAESARGGDIRRRQRAGQTSVRSKIGDRYVVISHGRPSTKDPGPNRIPHTADDGFIWPMGKDFATKFKTETDLMFGDKRVPSGRYSLWAKKSGAGWSLLVNAKPDIWSTQHDPTADLAEVPLELGKLDEEVELLTFDIKQEAGEGVIRMTWGLDSMTARFKPAQ